MSNLSTSLIQARIEELWAHPDRRGLVYSSDGAVPKSKQFETKRWDWTLPIVSTAIGTDMVPITFGCPVVKLGDGRQWFHKIIHSPEDVEKIAIPSVETGPCGEVLRKTAELAATLPPGTLIRQADVLSPLSIAELLWDDSFYLALIEAPGAVHKLLEKITEFTITFIKTQKQLAGDRFVAAGFPLIWSKKEGMYVSDDTLSLISPAMHLEFSIPYLNRLSEVFGGLYYHTCTVRPRYFDNVHQIKNIHGFNWNPGNSAPAHEIIREFSGKFVLTPHFYPEIHQTTDVLRWPNLSFANEIEFMRYCLESMGSNTAMSWWLRSDVCADVDLAEKLYDLFDAYGFTPARWKSV